MINDNQKRKNRRSRIKNRTGIPHFGSAKPGLDTDVTLYSQEDVYIESPFTKPKDPMEELLKNIEKQRINRSKMKLKDNLKDNLKDIESNIDKTVYYIPPAMRKDANKNLSSGSTMGFNESISLRISNISLDTTQSQLEDLFYQYSKVTRVKIVTDHNTQKSRGFAFVSFSSKNQALEAMENLRGYGLNHSILHLELATRE